jgi:hypothetical protein
MLKKAHFRPFLALPQTSKKEAFSPPKNTKFIPQNAPKKEKFLLRSNRKTHGKQVVRNRGVQ